jgi:flagellin
MGKIALQSALQVRGASAAGTTTVGTSYDATTNLSATSADTTSISSFSVSDLTQALENVATLRAENGGISSRLQFSNQNLETKQGNIDAANSRIIDTDIATESSRFARLNIKTQASAAMLAQANQLQGIALSLLG